MKIADILTTKIADLESRIHKVIYDRIMDAFDNDTWLDGQYALAFESGNYSDRTFVVEYLTRKGEPILASALRSMWARPTIYRLVILAREFGNAKLARRAETVLELSRIVAAVPNVTASALIAAAK